MDPRRSGTAAPFTTGHRWALRLITMPGTEISRLPMAVCALVTVVLKAQVSGMALTVGWGGKALGRIWRGGQVVGKLGRRWSCNLYFLRWPCNLYFGEKMVLGRRLEDCCYLRFLMRNISVEGLWMI